MEVPRTAETVIPVYVYQTDDTKEFLKFPMAQKQVWRKVSSSRFSLTAAAGPSSLLEEFLSLEEWVSLRVVTVR
ncbi:hypothetical protein AMECASPLE_021182 [Ameca splendens]|uniref:Uncharacterized protein n=1 Tax=Ameca splendens TaxID=208324 RepID=A0ABV0YEM4_9TELE